MKLGDFFFRNRSYIPIPFLLVSIIFMNPTIWSILSGLLIALLGELIRLWSVSYAGSETRTTTSVGGSQLVTHGPYALVRNPIYVGNIMIYTGIGIMSNTFFPYLQIVGFLFFLFQYYCIVLKEEEFLREKFGEVYEKFFDSINRFLPTFSNTAVATGSSQNIDLRKGFISEKRSLQALTISAVTIIIGFIIKNWNT